MRLFAMLCLAGCSYTFDGDTPDYPLVGPIPATNELPKLNINPVVDVLGQRIGADNKIWMVFTEAVPTDGGYQVGTRAVNVDTPSTFELYFDNPPQKDLYLGSYSVWHIDRDDPDTVMNPKTRLHIRSIGQADDGEHFVLDGSPGYFAIDPTERQFLYWVDSPNTTTLLLQKRDNSFSRQIPLPAGTVLKGGNITGITLFYTSDSKYLIVRDGNGDITRYSASTAPDLDLGTYPAIAAIDGSRSSLLFCDSMSGFTSVPWNGGTTLVLDADPCSSASGIFYYGNVAYYFAGSDTLEMRRVPVDGSKQPEPVVFPGKRIIGFSPKGELVYSTNGPNDYIESVGDGWYNGWRFMERGLDQGFSADKKKLRWVDDAAQEGAIGQLYSAVIPATGDPAPTPTLLSRNVWAWEELSDGRVLVEENHAFKGSFNRLVVVDEVAGQKQYVAQSVYAYQRLSRTTWDVIGYRWLATGSDLVRVTIPH